MADYKSLDNLKVTVEVSPVVDPATGAVSFKGDNIKPVIPDNVNVLAAIGEIVSDPTKAKDLTTITTTGGSSSQSSKGGKSKKNRKSKKARKARKSLRRK